MIFCCESQLDKSKTCFPLGEEFANEKDQFPFGLICCLNCLSTFLAGIDKGLL